MRERVLEFHGGIMVSKVVIAGSALLGTMAMANAAHVPGELLVKFKNVKSISGLSKTYGFNVDRTINLSYGKIHVLKVEDKNFGSLKTILSEDPNVEYAEPNFIYTIVKPVEELSLDQILTPPTKEFSNYTPTDPK